MLGVSKGWSGQDRGEYTGGWEVLSEEERVVEEITEVEEM
jgi:hypothetical protein